MSDDNNNNEFGFKLVTSLPMGRGYVDQDHLSTLRGIARQRFPLFHGALVSMRAVMAPGLSAAWEKQTGKPWLPSLTEDGILVWDPRAVVEDPKVMAQEYINNLFHLILNHPRQLNNAIKLGLVNPEDAEDVERFNLATDLVAHYYHHSAVKQDLDPSFERAGDYAFKEGGTAPEYNELLKQRGQDPNSESGGGGADNNLTPSRHPLWSKQVIDSTPGPAGDILRQITAEIAELKRKGELSDLDAAEQDQRTAKIISQMAKEAKDKNLEPGDWLGDLVRALDAPKPPKISPREILKRTIRGKVKAKRGHRKQTFKKIHRAYVDLACQRQDPMIIPGHQRFRARVLMVTDTSGSRWGEEMQDSADLVCAVLKELKTPLEHISVDMDIQSNGIVTSFKDIQKLLPKGGGGTDFATFFKWFDENGDDIDLVIFMTDGYTGGVPESYPPKTAQKFVWIIDKHGIKCANFGKTIFLGEEKN